MEKGKFHWAHFRDPNSFFQHPFFLSSFPLMHAHTLDSTYRVTWDSPLVLLCIYQTFVNPVAYPFIITFF